MLHCYNVTKWQNGVVAKLQDTFIECEYLVVSNFFHNFAENNQWKWLSLDQNLPQVVAESLP